MAQWQIIWHLFSGGFFEGTSFKDRPKHFGEGDYNRYLDNIEDIDIPIFILS